MIRALILCLMLSSGLRAQTAPPATINAVVMRLLPEPMAVPTSVLANARDLGRWTVVIKNNTALPTVVYVEDILINSGPVAFVTADDALLVLNANVRRSTAQRIVTVLSYAGKGAAIGLAVASRANFGWSMGVGVGASLLPDVITIAQGAVPSAVPLTSNLKWPVTLGPGQAITDHMFAAKMRNPRPVTMVIR